MAAADRAQAFLALSERQIAAPVQARRRAAEKRAARKFNADRDQELEDRTRQLKRWQVWRQERLDRALAGRHGKALAKLIARLRTDISDADLIEQAQSWRHADVGTRFLVLHLIDQAIIRRRERDGLPPFDDTLPGKPPSAFLIIRNMLE
jgi:hypothetical protein